MKELKNLLELRSQQRVTPEVREQIQKALKPLLESTNCELLLTDPSVEVTLHPIALHSKIDRLCDSIDHLVDINQALLAYIVDLDGGAADSIEAQSLD